MPSGANVAYLNKSKPRTDISDKDLGLPPPKAADIRSLLRRPPRPLRPLTRGRPSWWPIWLLSGSDVGEVEAAAAAAAAAMKAAAAETGGWWCWKAGGETLPSWGSSGWCEMVGVIDGGGEVRCCFRGVVGSSGWVSWLWREACRLAPPPGGERSKARGLCTPEN